MERSTQSKQLAFDTNVLINLVDREDAALTLKEVLAEKNVSVAIPPMVVQELFALSLATDSAVAASAIEALRNIRAWGFKTYDLRPVDHGISKEFAQSLIRKKLLPENEMNDGCILGEVSLGDVKMLVTSDNHLLSIDQAALDEEFFSKDLARVSVMSPKRILRTFAPPSRRPGRY